MPVSSKSARLDCQREANPKIATCNLVPDALHPKTTPMRQEISTADSSLPWVFSA